MATRSRIAIENQDGTVKSVYCHWDGYPSNNGKILQENYQDLDKVEKLIKLGQISYIAEEVEAPEGAPHSFESPMGGVTVAYHRDRGEDYIQPKEHQSLSGFVKSDVEEYGYVFTKEGEWLFVNGHKSPGAREAEPLVNVL